MVIILNKQPNITENTKKAFIEAFCIINRQKPIEKITIQELTKKAGYNRCTFYQYFKDIYDLRDHIENIVIDHVKENFQKNISKDNFSETFIAAFTKIQSEKAIYFDLLLDRKNRSHFIERLNFEVSSIFIEKFNLSLDDLRTKYFVEIYFSIVITAISCWIDQKRDLTLENLSNLIREILTDGIISKIIFKY